VDAEPEVAVGQLLDRDRIVEVAAVLAVDGDRRRIAEIGAARMSFSATDVPSRTASAIASAEWVSEMPYLRMMISVSTPGALMSPSTSVTWPMAPRLAVSQRVSSTITISPGEAPPS
jgi:hypothetical protein